MAAVVKAKRCKAPRCRETFIPRSTTDSVCSLRCALAFARTKPDKIAKLAKRARIVERREDRERIKTKREHEEDAQAAFNAFIRERDRFDPCICCNRWPRTHSNHQWDAGHWRTVAAAPQLRFNEDNCHKQLVSCNRGKSGNAVDYRIRLIEKIGPERVEALENDNSVVRRSIDELKAVGKEYRAKTRDLKRLHELGHREAVA